MLEPSGIKVWIVNARHVKNVPGHKTDKKDSVWFCKLLLAGLLKPSYIPPKEQRELRDLTRYRKKLIQDIASNKNRIIRILEDCNVKLSSVLSDTSGVTATKLIDKLCDGKQITMEDIEAVYHKKIEATKEELWEACNGIVSEHHVYLLQTIRANTRDIERLIEELNQKIKAALSPYENALERLREIPGLSRKMVEDLIAEIGLDMEVFPTEEHLCSRVGVSPGNNESAGKKKRTNHARKQAGQNHIDGSIVGCHPYQGHFLQSPLSPLSRPTGQKTSRGCRSTLHSQIGLSRAQRRCALSRTRGRLFRLPNGRQAEKVPQKGT